MIFYISKGPFLNCFWFSTKRQYRVSRCENDAIADESESNVVVRRVLVLIQVGSLRSPRQAHACHNLTVATRKNQACNGRRDARSPLSRLAILRMIPVGADVDFMKLGWPDDLPSVSLLHLLDDLGADLPDIHSIHKAGEVIEKQKLLILHPNGTHHVVIQYIGFEILGEPT